MKSFREFINEKTGESNDLDKAIRFSFKGVYWAGNGKWENDEKYLYMWKSKTKLITGILDKNEKPNRLSVDMSPGLYSMVYNIMEYLYDKDNDVEKGEYVDGKYTELADSIEPVGKILKKLKKECFNMDFNDINKEDIHKIETILNTVPTFIQNKMSKFKFVDYGIVMPKSTGTGYQPKYGAGDSYI